MTPPNADFHSDHLLVVEELTNLGYEVSVTDRFPADIAVTISIANAGLWLLGGPTNT